MRPLAAWALVLAGAAGTAAAFAFPWQVPAALAAVSLWALPRRAVWLGAALTMAVQALLVGLFAGGDGPGPFSTRGLQEGAVAGARLVAAVGVNLAILARARPARLLEGLRLGRRATAFSSAVVLCVQDLGREARNAWDARTAEGSWPRGWRPRVRAVAATVPHLLVVALASAQRRAESLHLAGIPVGPAFAPVVALTALSVLGRLAFVAVPNVALTYVVAFAGGLWFGSRLGAGSAMAAMAATNLVLTGLAPTPFVNVPAMGAVALAGAACRRVDLGGAGGAFLAGAIGVVATAAFSATADTLEWLLVPELRRHVPLPARLLAGLAFNIPAAVANALLFSGAAGALSRARAALRAAPR
ncbi:MAG TPA: hypothetical protein VFH47_03115 [Candidatus Thermoplasmatota archaeon]|nr:hypothetical protein [Candidatus Thermoplasmatota archaeon]